MDFKKIIQTIILFFGAALILTVIIFALPILLLFFLIFSLVMRKKIGAGLDRTGHYGTFRPRDNPPQQKNSFSGTGEVIDVEASVINDKKD